ncbi:MAG TPA: SMC family ATPase [Gemmatimonadaceae bacterium]|nr:SMC family ATPase [Gemmatimonadaceae bacterium]
MRLNQLVLSNFRQHADTRIEFESGVTGIIGANGSGKSTILEAIAWAIYGNPAARGTRETIRFHRAGARAAVRVELDFDLGNHRYRVVRGLTSAELYLDGAPAPIANSITGVTELLTRRLGMSREEFFNTYFTGQKELSVMAAMGPSERAQFLSHVLGYEKLRAAQRLLREQRSSIAAEIAGLRQGMPDAEQVAAAVRDARARVSNAVARSRAAVDDAARARAAVGAVLPRFEAAQRERERMQELLSELRVAEGELASLEREHERIARELGEVATAREELERMAAELAPFGALQAEFQRLEVLAREEGRRQALLETQRALEAELEQLRQRHEKVSRAPTLEQEVQRALDERRHDLEDADGQLEARRTEWVRDRQEAETKRQALREQFADLKQQRDRLAATGPDEPCPTCLRPLGESLRSVMELLDAQIETVRVDGNYYKQRLDQLVEMPAEVRALDEHRRAVAQEVTTLERRLTKVQLAVQELAQLAGDIGAKEERRAQLARDLAAIPPGYDPARHEVVRRELERLLPLEGRAARLSAQVEREPSLVRDESALRERLSAAAERVAQLTARRAALPDTEAEFAALRQAHEDAAQRLRAAELSAASSEAEAAGARLALEMAERQERELREREQTLGDLSSRKRLHDELDRAYTDLRTDLNFQLRPELSELASVFLVELTGGRYAELDLDDQYNIRVLEDGIPKPVISGGEEDIANLVLRLAISQMIAERAGQPLSLLVLDEIFGSLDELRRAGVITLLRGLQDRFEQVILITHIEAIRDSVDHVVSVRYDEESGSSVVRQFDGAPIAPLVPDSERAPAREYEQAGAGD